MGWFSSSPAAFLLVTAVLMRPAEPVWAQQQQAGPAELPKGVQVKVSAEPQKATVGDAVRIDFDILLPPGYRVEFPSLASQMGDFSILQTFQGPSVPGPDTAPEASSGKSSEARSEESGHHHSQILVALYKPGDYEFPPLTLSLKDPSGKQMPLSSPAVKVRIESVLTGKNDALKDLKRQAEIPEPSRWLLWLGIFLLLAMIAMVSWWFWRRRRRLDLPTQPRIDPLQLAEAELRELLARDWLEKGLIKQFYVVLADIVKKMLEAGYGIQTVEKTTSEIMGELQPALSHIARREESVRIESLLVCCDMVKFARTIPSRPETDSAVNSAVEILEYCRRRRMESAPALPGVSAEVH